MKPILVILCLSPVLFGLGAIAMAIANKKVELRTRRHRWMKFWSYLIVVYLVIFAIISGSKVFAGLIIAVLILGGAELLAVNIQCNGNSKMGFSRVFTCVSSCMWFCVLGFGTFRFALDTSAQESVFVYLLVAIVDGFSQLTGQLFGQHKIAPKISPNKTVEGALGGVLSAILLGISLCWFVKASVVLTAINATCIAIAAFAGDLTASWIKRANGIKDFSNLIPCQGGILDRFDSLLMAATVYWVLH